MAPTYWCHSKDVTISIKVGPTGGTKKYNNKNTISAQTSGVSTK